MHFFGILLTILIQFFVFIVATQHHIALNQREPFESVTLSKIIANYLIKYFGDEEMYISIVAPPSDKRVSFEEDFFRKFLHDVTLLKFGYNCLDKLDTSRFRRNAFNLIFIDTHLSLL